MKTCPNRTIQIETVTLNDGSRMDVIRDIEAVRVLEKCVRELEEAGDLMCKYYLVYGPESVMAKEAWLKAKGQQ